MNATMLILGAGMLTGNGPAFSVGCTGCGVSYPAGTAIVHGVPQPVVYADNGCCGGLFDRFRSRMGGCGCGLFSRLRARFGGGCDTPCATAAPCDPCGTAAAAPNCALPAVPVVHPQGTMPPGTPMAMPTAPAVEAAPAPAPMPMESKPLDSTPPAKSKITTPLPAVGIPVLAYPGTRQ